MVLTPAYGRDYKSKQEVLRDWNDNKDFLLQHYSGHTRLINKEQIPIGDSIQFRYKKMAECFTHKNK